MKLIIIAFLIISCTFIDAKFKVRKSEKSGMKSHHKKYNPLPPDDSITYGYATNDQYVMQNLAV